MTGTVTITRRRYGGSGGQRWRVDTERMSFEHEDPVIAEAFGRQLARSLHAHLVVSDLLPGQSTLELVTDEHLLRLAKTLGTTNADWAAQCDAGIAELAKTGLPFEAYDLVLAGIPEPSHPNHWGPRFAMAARQGVIEPIGYQTSRRPSTHYSAVRTWCGVPNTTEATA